MKTCPKCSRELSDDAKFCGGCGTKIEEIVFCPNCGAQANAKFAFCQQCGSALNKTTAAAAAEPMAEPAAEPVLEPMAVPVAQATVVEQPAKVPAKKKKLPKKAILFGGIGVAVVAVLVLLICLIAGGGKAENNYVLYLKDREIFFNNLKKNGDSWQLTSRLVDTEDIDNEDLVDHSYYLGRFSYMSENGKYIFFPDKAGYDIGFNLYYKEVAKPDADAIKVDSDVRSYIVNDSATLITYLKGEEGNLYQYNIGKDSKEKIASEVDDYEVSGDGKKIIYLSKEYSIYLKQADQEKEKIASEISYMQHLTEDLKTVYYVKDDSLYKQVIGEERVKIVSDVYDILKIYDSGEMYYVTKTDEEIHLMDYVIDDTAAEDSAITEPVSPEYPDSPAYPSWWNYDTDAAYEAAYKEYEEAYAIWEEECDRLYTEYQEAYEAYWAKESRDLLREELKEVTMEHSRYSLCFYNGEEEIVMTDAFIDDYSYNIASKEPVITYKACSQESDGKVKISEIDSIYDVEYLVDDAFSTSAERYIAVKDSATVIEQQKAITNIRINPTGTIVYYIDNIPDEKDHGELYRVSINKGVVGEPELYDSDVYGYCYFTENDQFVYYKDYKDGTGELYIDKEKIDYDVNIYNTSIYDDKKEIFYFTDWNSEKEYGTLKVYRGNKSEKIADDVHTYTVTPDGQVLYLYDYSLNYCKGELFEWDNGKTRRIDDDVVTLLPIFNSKFRRGYAFGW